MSYKFEKPYACFFPTKTLFIDDSRDFLDGISLNLSHELQSYDFFDDIDAATDLIRSNSKERDWFKHYIQNFEEEKSEHKIVEFNISDIHKRIYNPNRFNVITSLVIDYDMPAKNGLSLCEEIKDANIYKILLTGAADEKLVIEAFNAKVIDAFIPKHKDNVYDLIKNAIQKGAMSYFSSLSNIIFTSIENERDREFLTHESFINMFNSLLRANRIVEYYIIESTGSFLMINECGEISLLFFIPEHHLTSMYELAKEEDFPDEIILSLKNRSKMLCFFDLEKENFLYTRDYRHYLEDAKEINLGNNKYYYAYKKCSNESLKIDTFQKFLIKENTPRL